MEESNPFGKETIRRQRLRLDIDITYTHTYIYIYLYYTAAGRGLHFYKLVVRHAEQSCLRQTTRNLNLAITIHLSPPPLSYRQLLDYIYDSKVELCGIGNTHIIALVLNDDVIIQRRENITAFILSSVT